MSEDTTTKKKEHSDTSFLAFLLPKESFVFSQILFLKLLTVVYLIAFTSLFVQIPTLYGADGVLPIKRHLDRVETLHRQNKLNVMPTIFWFSDTILTYIPLPDFLTFFETNENLMHILCLASIFICLLVLITNTHFLSFWTFFILWASYLSIFQVGQTFLTFQWDMLLLEVGFLAMFYSPAKKGTRLHSDEVSVSVRELIKWLFFRFMFASGVVKLLSGCPTWWSLAALDWHFESQPIPSPLSRFAHFLPREILKLGVVKTFIVEIFLPICFYVPVRSLRIFSALMQILLQILITVSGNFNFFNILTIVLSLSLLDDTFLLQYTPKLILYLTGVNTYDREPLIEAKKVHGTLAQTLRGVVINVTVILGLIFAYFPLEMMMNGKVNFDINYLRDTIIDSYLLTCCVYMAILTYLYRALRLSIPLEKSARVAESRGRVYSIVKLFKFLFATAFAGYIFLASLQPFYDGIEANLDKTHINKDLIQASYKASQNFHITGAYGPFRRITGVGGRPEIIIEGSSDGQHWKEYEFFYKVGNVSRMDKWVAPHQPRIDWQMWFAALSEITHQHWLINMLGRIFSESESVLKVFSHNPFPDSPPKYLRIRSYKYHFEELGSSTGNWWNRDNADIYLDPITKESLARPLHQLNCKPVQPSTYPINPMQNIPVVQIVVAVLLVNMFRTVFGLRRYESTNL